MVRIKGSLYPPPSKGHTQTRAVHVPNPNRVDPLVGRLAREHAWNPL